MHVEEKEQGATVSLAAQRWDERHFDSLVDDLPVEALDRSDT
jgi:hypothetical protein